MGGLPSSFPTHYADYLYDVHPFGYIIRWMIELEEKERQRPRSLKEIVEANMEPIYCWNSDDMTITTYYRQIDGTLRPLGGENKVDEGSLGPVFEKGVIPAIKIALPIFLPVVTGGNPSSSTNLLQQALQTLDSFLSYVRLASKVTETACMFAAKFGKGENAQKVQYIASVVGDSCGLAKCGVSMLSKPEEIGNRWQEYGEELSEPIAKGFTFAMRKDYKDIKIFPDMAKCVFSMYGTIDSAKNEFNFPKTFFETKGLLEKMIGERIPTTSVVDNLEMAHDWSPEWEKIKKSISKEH